ncbi:MAG: LysR family transcriptional regulator YeiE [Firmicutes bacterium]|nr:LysR family transcriptional regulator YeiE [Bacillota bacterium]MDI6705509.1 LysR family transcriptional regulator [Bacillota bacterium]
MTDIRLVTFIALAKTKSFTKASEILNITQPAVSQHIRYLEGYYGIPLVKKKRKGIELTEEGEILLKYAQDIDLLYKTLEMKLKNRAGTVKTYHVGASMTIGGYVLPHILGKHKKLYQNIDILLQVNNTVEILEKLSMGTVDFAVVEGLFDKGRFKFKKLKDDELVLAVSPGHPFAKKESVSMEEVLAGNLIIREKGSGTRRVFEGKLTELGYDIDHFKGYMEVGSISAIKSLVELNLGYTIISMETIRRELETGTIKVVRVCSVKILVTL